MKKHLLKTTLLFLLLVVITSCKNTTTLESVASNYSRVDNIKIHYKEIGQGEKTLIFVHGWGCDLNTWKCQFDYFKDKHHMVFIDLPGYGKSDKPRVEYTIDFFAKSVKSVTEVSDFVLFR